MAAFLHASLWWGFRLGGGLVLLLSLPLIVELLALTLASLLPAGRRGAPGGALRPLAVIVPAHNEEKLIGRCVRSMVEHQPAGVTLYVVAHNCSDQTAAKAKEAGAEVLIMNDKDQRGKACALRSGFKHALAHGAEAVAVIDADSIVADNLLLSMQTALSHRAEAVQCLYKVLPAAGKPTASMTSIGFQGFNIVRPQGRERLGLSVGIFGNGFGLRREVLEQVPYQADSVVEDLEYHIQLVTAGKRVRLLEDATVYGEMPDGGQGNETQRARWEGGRVLMMRTFPPRLLRGILRGRLRLTDPLLDVLGLPLAIEALCLLLLIALPVSMFRWYGLAGLAILCFHFVVAVKAGPDFWSGMAVLLRVPRYILWKLILTPKILLASRRNASWVRTHRGESSDFSSSPPADALE
jgi:cellulose synthase/poly-beta-1,6-N-acetylglucosamine synthase-like glycosyltransferase